ncbi:hypothetical protein ACQKIS_00945 [Pseudomonas fulva]|uniref:hypothetical protein n=1 Tax=Pseudomonas fulva TaxID=47880 RepID=UPI003D077507
MLLGKSCKKEHHIKNGTIKLGTLYEYRSIENDELIDKHEGMLSFFLKFHGRVSIPTQWFVTLNGGAIGINQVRPLRFPGKSSAHFLRVEVETTHDERIVLIDSSAVISRESPNSFIFCVSHVRKTTDCIGIFPSCNDYWFIREAQAEAFARELGTMLLQQIYAGHETGNHIIPADADISSVKIHFEYGNVHYMERVTHIQQHSDLTLEEFGNKINNMAFTKPKSYSRELEYRFQFTILSNNKIVEPIVKSVFLDAAPLLDMIF